MTATVAIQSVPPTSVQGSESSARAASAKNNSETSNVKNEEKSSFKDLYDDAKKLDNTVESKTSKQDVDDAAGKKVLAEDGKSLPPEGKSGEAENKNEASLKSSTMTSDEDNGQDLLMAQNFSDLNLDETGVIGNGIAVGLAEPLTDKPMFSGIEKQPLDKEGENALSVLTGLNNTELLKLNTAAEGTDAKLAVNDKLLNNVPVIAPGADTRSLAQRLSLMKNEDGLTKKAGLNEMLGLSPDQLTDDSMMSDMDKALNKVSSTDKLSLDAMLGKLETLTNTAAIGQKPSVAAPLSTALNYAPTSPTQELSGVSQTTITETLGKAEWNQSMSKQISWMASQHIRSAEIKLTPSNLGTIEVRVDMNDDKLNVVFSSRDIGVRDSVEQAMPKLREMMEEQGLELGDTNVSEQTFFEQQDERFSQQESFARNVEHENRASVVDSVNVEESIMPTVNTSMTAVDYYI